MQLQSANPPQLVDIQDSTDHFQHGMPIKRRRISDDQSRKQSVEIQVNQFVAQQVNHYQHGQNPAHEAKPDQSARRSHNPGSDETDIFHAAKKIEEKA